jgi:RNA polymerase sigma-70 factor (ECF subfamily)
MDKEVDILITRMVGNKVEFHKMYQQYHPSLMSYASSIVNTDAAEDIVQDTFLYVWEHWESLSANRNIKAYLYSIVYSRCIDYLRKTAMIGRHIVTIKTDDNKEPESEYEKQIPDKNNTLEYLYKKDFYKHLDFLMKQMPTRRKEIFFMAYLEGIKAKEIAKQFQMPIRTVESHLYLAVKFLKKNMTRSHFLP